MRRTLLLLTSMAIILGLPSAVCRAQNYLNGMGNQTWGINLPIENGYINVANGDVHLEIPLATLPQRGGVPLQESLVYDSRIWAIYEDEGIYSFNPFGVPGNLGVLAGGTTAPWTNGWRFVAGPAAGKIAVNASGDVYSFAYTDPSGAAHLFGFLTAAPSCSGCGQPTSNSGYALDGSGYYMTVTNSTTATVYDSSGNEVAPSVVDRNGNTFSQDSNGNLIDTLGRTPVVRSTSGNDIYYDVLTVGGAKKRYTVTTETLNTAIAFNQPGVADPQFSLTAIQSITLPDGSSYSFTYDTNYGNYGELMSMKLPTGGTVQFEWGTYIDSYQNYNRWLAYYSGGMGNYDFQPSVVSQCKFADLVDCKEQVTVIDGNSNSVNYLFTLNDGAWNTQTDYYTGRVDLGGATHIASTATSYDYSNSCPSDLSGIVDCTGSVWITAGNTTTTLSDTGQMAQTQYTFTYPWSGKPSSIKRWDYYTGTASTVPTTETDVAYGSMVNGAYYPTQIKQLGSGTLVAQTVLSYDHGTPATASGATQLTSAPGGTVRGNLTGIVAGVGTTVATSSTYDTAGQKLKDIDGNTNSTFYSYQCSDAYLGTVTYPVVVGGANLQTQTTYDCSSGLIASTKDENGVVNNLATTYTYYPSGTDIGRLERVAYPDGGSTTYTYPSAIETDQKEVQTSSVDVASKTILDQFGRPYQSVLTAPEGNISSETSYDATGKPNCVTTPHLGTVSATDGSTCTYYDVLGRATKTTMPDGNAVTATYNDPSQTIVDELSNSKQFTFDAFHRLTKVMEPNSSGTLSYETDYQYNALDELVEADQWGGANGASSPGDRKRLFSYDSLGRKIAENIPENQSVSSPASKTCPGAPSGTHWTSCFSYDGNGNQTSSTDNSGRTVTYQYDSINRLMFKRYSDGTSTAGFGYDGNDEAGSPISGSVNAIGRLSHTSNESNAAANYSYDPMGRLKQQLYCVPQNCSYNIAVSAQYDLLGNMTSLSYPDGRVVSQSFDSANRSTGIKYAAWGSTNVGSSYFSVSKFAPPGQPTSSTLGDGVGLTATYTSRQSISSLTYSGSKGTLWSMKYSWDKNASNLLLALDEVTGYGRQFTYDSLNRVITAKDIAVNNPGTTKSTATVDIEGAVQSIQDCRGRCCSNCVTRYDSGTVTVTVNGILAGSSVYGKGGLETPPEIIASLVPNINSNNLSPVTASYSGSGNLLTLTSINGGSSSNYSLSAAATSGDPADFTPPSFTATPSGATMTGGSGSLPLGGILSQTFTYDPFGNLTQAGSYGFSQSFTSLNQINGYSYDANGNQNTDAVGQALAFDANEMLSSVAAGTETYVYDAQGNRVEVHGSPVTDYIYFGGLPIATLSSGSYLDLIYSADSLLAEVGGTSSALPTYRVTDNLGTLGGSLLSSSALTSELNYAPYGQHFAGTTSDPFGFTGLLWDSTTGTNHAATRQFSIAQGRWQSPDHYEGSYNWGDPQSLNRYAYVNGKPMAFSDPSGQDGGISGSTAGGCAGAVLSGGANGAADAFCVGGLVMNIIDDLLFGKADFHGSLKPRPGTGPIWTQDDTFGVPYPGLGGAIGQAAGGSVFQPSGGCEFGACGTGQNSLGPGSWSSGAYPNGNDPSDLNLFGGFWNAVKRMLYGSEECHRKAEAARDAIPLVWPGAKDVFLGVGGGYIGYTLPPKLGGGSAPGAGVGAAIGLVLPTLWSYNSRDIAYANALIGCNAAEQAGHR